MDIINGSIKQTMNWLSKRTGILPTIKEERGLVRHLEWNDVQLLFEVADNNATGMYKLLDVLEEFYTEYQDALANREVQVPVNGGFVMFFVRDDHLWVRTLPDTANPYSVKDGHLIVRIPKGDI